MWLVVCEAVLCEQLQELKHKHEIAKKAAREAKKMEKNALRKRTRLLKVLRCFLRKCWADFPVQLPCVPMFITGRLPKGCQRQICKFFWMQRARKSRRPGGLLLVM